MNRLLLMTVGKRLLVIFLAVFFARSAHSGDSPLRQVETGMHELIYRLSRSIVAVEATRSVTGSFPGTSSSIMQTVSSTGLICDSAGHVLVNASSVAGYDHIQLSGEDRSVPGRLLAVDYQNDLALLDPGPSVGDPVIYSDAGLCAGQMVLSLTSANGLRASPSIGFCAGCRPDGILQFSIPISPTGAGGGIFDLSGHLIGIITNQFGNPNLQTSALPSYKLPEIVNHLLTKGTRWAGFAGIATKLIQIMPPLELPQGEMRLAAFGTSTFVDHGAVVSSVLAGSPAAKAGVMPGDLVLEIGEHRVESPDDVARLVTVLEPGRIVPFKLFRRDRLLDVRVQIDARPSDLLSGTNQLRQVFAPSGRSRTADSLLEILSRLREEVSRVERRLQSLD
jgi:S1-C subfamily serine protease